MIMITLLVWDCCQKHDCIIGIQLAGVLCAQGSMFASALRLKVYLICLFQTSVGH